MQTMNALYGLKNLPKHVWKNLLKLWETRSFDITKGIMLSLSDDQQEVKSQV